jgi:hypothetical protein
MAVGDTITQSLADSIPTMVAMARQVREQEAVMAQVTDRQQLARNTGTVWNEISMEKLTSAQGITESTTLDNPQQLVDTNLAITPTLTGIMTVVTDEMAMRISRKALAQTGGLAQAASQRKKDEDGLVAIDGATTDLAGAGVTITSGHVSAASVSITSDATEPGQLPLFGVFHGFQIKDFADELTTPVGTYDITGDGLTSRAYREGFRGMIHSVRIVEDGNYTITAAADVNAGVFARRAIVLVESRTPKVESIRKPELGGGSTAFFHYDGFAFGERSPGNWLFGVIGDATVPTS